MRSDDNTYSAVSPAPPESHFILRVDLSRAIDLNYQFMGVRETIWAYLREKTPFPYYGNIFPVII